MNAPTRLYCDCKPVIQVVSGDRTMTESTRALDLKVWKLRERVDVQDVSVVWCSTVDEQSDLNTKALPTRQFRYLRDNLNGYGLVMLHSSRLRGVNSDDVVIKQMQHHLSHDKLYSRLVSHMNFQNHHVIFPFCNEN